MTLSDKITIIEATNDIGNGKTNDTIKTVTMETNSQARYFLPKGPSLALLIDTFWSLYYLTHKRFVYCNATQLPRHRTQLSIIFWHMRKFCEGF